MSAEPRPPKDAPSVGMVVVNYNGAAFVDEFARSLADVDYPNLHVILVDNGSQDGPAAPVAPDHERARPPPPAQGCSWGSRGHPLDPGRGGKLPSVFLVLFRGGRGGANHTHVPRSGSGCPVGVGA